MKSIFFNVFHVLIILHMIFITKIVYAEEEINTDSPTTEQSVDTTVEDIDQKTTHISESEWFLKIGDAVLGELKSKLSDEKFAEIEKISNEKISNQILAANLKKLETPEFVDSDIKIILDTIQNNQRFIIKIKKISPDILKRHEIKSHVLEKEKLLKSITIDAEKNKITKEIEALNNEAMKLDFSFDASEGVSEHHVNQISIIFEEKKYEDEKIKIIRLAIKEKIIFIKKIETVKTIINSIDTAKKHILDKEIEIKNSELEEEKKKISKEIEKLGESFKELEKNFTVITTGIDIDSIYKSKDKEFSFDKEIQDIFSPLVVSMKEITERPRKMEFLRSEIVYYEEKLPQIQEGIKYINKFMSDISHNDISKKLRDSEIFWIEQEQEFTTKLDTAKLSLLKLEKERASVSEMLSHFADLIQERGAHLLWAILAFCITYFSLYFLRKLLLGLLSKGSSRPSFFSKLLDIVFYVISIVIALLATMSVLYLNNEWLFLFILLVLIVGIIWGSKNSLPKFIEQIKLFLDIGTVRCGERVSYNGLSWYVESIGIYSYLKNPLLTSSTIRLPIRDLIALRSRPYDDEESWFPTRIGDWLTLGDGSYGQILVQTIDTVKISTNRGSYKSYTAKDFIQNNPKNLSINLFSVNNILNLDFKHSDIVIDRACAKVKSVLKEKIAAKFYGKYLKGITVELKDFDNSALNIITTAQFSGEAASEYTEIGQLLQQAALESCNQNGWTIAVNQVALHRAIPTFLEAR